MSFVLAVAVAAAVGAAPGTASSTPTPGELQGECPTVMPLSDVATGMHGTALSVTAGRNPVTFGAEVLGILRDAIGPGRHIIIVDLSGSAVDAAGGLWYGASGSPVFFQDASTGRYELAGAIAYGLAGGGSTLAGLTPAADMAALLSPLVEAAAATEAVSVPRPLAQRMSEASGLSVTQLSSLVRLKTPLSASGLTERGLRRMQAAIDRQGLPFFAYMGSSTTGTPPPQTPGLRAGDSFAAALSTGDITVAGIGTTTFVCEGRAVAFGHPFNWTGETTMAAHAADTITIVRDPVWGSYKLANVAESLGAVTQDRLAGIVGELGTALATSPVTSTVTDLDSGRTRSGRSDVVLPEFLPFLAFEHLLLNVDVTIDRIGPGNADVAYTIRGTRDGGATWALSRATRYASAWDISYESVIEPAFTAELLQAFDGEEITVTSIDVSKLDVESDFEQYQLRNLLVWDGSKYVRKNVVRGGPGKVFRLRAVLKPVHAVGNTNVDFTLRVPERARRSGSIEAFGGGSGGFDVPCFLFDEECEDGGGGTFDELLAALADQPRGDALVARFRLGPWGAKRGQITRQQDAVVFGRRVIGFRLVR